MNLEPETPQTSHNNDSLEKSLRRQNASNISISDIARRFESPQADLSRMSERHGGGGPMPSISGSAQNMSPVNSDEFQQWMKMVKTKRVKTDNAFTIQLIDAFYSMVQGHVLTNSGSRYTFQEATHTLGGCLTVYKNRIARVKDDTSRLLVGVTEKQSRGIPDSQNGLNEFEDAQNAHNDDSSDPENGNGDLNKSRSADAATRRLRETGDAFLVSGRRLEIDPNDLKSAIDPLLRKMSADFDKRGAGALLQYSLSSDLNGRLLLDADTQSGVDTELSVRGEETVNNAQPGAQPGATLASIAEEEEEEEEEEKEEVEGDEMQVEEEEADPCAPERGEISERGGTSECAALALAHFHLKYFSNFDFENCESLPLVDSINRAVQHPKEATNALVQEMQAWAMSDPAEVSNYIYEEDAGDDAGGGGGGGGDFEGGEFDGQFDAQDAAAPFDDPNDDDDNHNHNHNHNYDDADSGADLTHDFANLSIASIVSSQMPADGNWQDINYLRSLDTHSTNWAGPSFWKVQRLHAAGTNKPSAKPKPSRATAVLPPAQIDFFSDDVVDLKALFARPSRSINLPRSQMADRDHTLPTDMHFTTKGLTSLYQLPDGGMAPAFRKGPWRHYGAPNDAGEVSQLDSNGGGGGGGDGIDDDADSGGIDLSNYYYESWDTKPETAADLFNTKTPNFGTYNKQLNFAKVAKRVDVRRLKQNVWDAIEREQTRHHPHHQQQQQHPEDHEVEPSTGPADSESQESIPGDGDEPVHSRVGLLNIIRETQPLYNETQRSELSPAMYFVSLLHLSNEKGLRLENTPNYTDVNVILC